MQGSFARLAYRAKLLAPSPASTLSSTNLHLITFCPASPGWIFSRLFSQLTSRCVCKSSGAVGFDLRDSFPCIVFFCSVVSFFFFPFLISTRHPVLLFPCLVPLVSRLSLLKSAASSPRVLVSQLQLSANSPRLASTRLGLFPASFNAPLEAHLPVWSSSFPAVRVLASLSSESLSLHPPLRPLLSTDFSSPSSSPPTAATPSARRHLPPPPARSTRSPTQDRSIATMADAGAVSTAAQPVGAAAAQNGQGNPTHLPPPPLHIPQNNNPIPTAMTSPRSGVDGGGILSPTTGFRRAAPEPNKRALYVGGLDQRVTEDVLRQIFETTGHVQNVKIIPDKNAKGYNYGFVEYDDPGAADRAMATLNGRRVHQSEIRVNWAYQSNTTTKEDTSNHFHIFVGDLSNEVNDDILHQAFSAFGSVSEARVMWDMKTGRSRGYGFVAFRDRPDAEKALSSMDGEWLGSRAIRCNWANQKGQPSMAQQQAMQAMGMTPTTPFGHHQFPAHGIASYEMILAQTPNWQTTCYVGNLTPYTTHTDVVPLFQNFGFVVESRFQADRGFAFIKMDTHENAAMAICQMNGYNVNGRPLKCSWGKDKTPNSQSFDPQQQPYSPQTSQAPGFPGTPTYYPQYGAQYNGQQGNFGGPQAASPAGYSGSPMGYGGPQSAGGYGRGHQGPNGQWNQNQGQNFNNGFGGYQS